MRACPITITGAAAGVSAIFAGKPNSSIAPRALNIGHTPPKVMVEATLWELSVRNCVQVPKRTQKPWADNELGVYEHEARDMAKSEAVKHCDGKNV